MKGGALFFSIIKLLEDQMSFKKIIKLKIKKKKEKEKEKKTKQNKERNKRHCECKCGVCVSLFQHVLLLNTLNSTTDKKYSLSVI